MRFALTSAAVASLVASASAHATWQQLWINGVDAGTACTRQVTSNSPVTSASEANIACNVHLSNSNVCPIRAGDVLQVEMHQQQGDRSCKNEAIGGQHYGPVTVYMAKVSDAKTASPNSAGWFKVSEGGLMSNNPDYFAVQVLNDNCGHWSFTVPQDLAPGDYLIRAEVIALHAASASGGAQFYPGCFQVNVSGSGSANPPTVKFPGAYGSSDPGIAVNVHQDLTTYKIPGPAPYGSAAATVATTKWPTAATWNTANQPATVPTTYVGANPPSATATTSTVVIPTTTASTPTSTPSTPAGGAALYGQCGGVGWSGPTTCAQGTCSKLNGKLTIS
ncbi:glycoside hydrolase family 61 protein H [Ephemerocybe angulata]|uniref:AA9 family lytic polysaccharide monooxygenase n=1 Tax=Ephemerocybe angulata TaxID=980116 RepID=A0A8H6IF34_9AGAR|nr:glycoside hydrolase family 61 protein H [Tulosesus angulatus]